MAVLQRVGGDSSGRGMLDDARSWEPARPARLSSAERSTIEAFWQPLIRLPLPERLVLRARDTQISEVYALPADVPDTTRLHVVRPGWRLGTLHTGAARTDGRTSRFEPDHALAIALRVNEVSQLVDESIGTELAARYLHGDILDVPGPDGWVLIAVEGFPLGWGKRSGGVVKNHYPKVLRRG